MDKRFVAFIVTVVKSEQFLNAAFPIEVTLAGIVTDVITVASKAEEPIDVQLLTPLKVALAKAEQLLNALFPIEVTLAGIVMDVRPELLKALVPIEVIFAGIVIDVKDVQPLNNLSLIVVKLALVGSVTLFKLVHPLKAEEPMLVTELGITILVNAVQPLKALLPMVVTVFGIVIVLMVVQIFALKAPSAIPTTVYSVDPTCKCSGISKFVGIASPVICLYFSKQLPANVTVTPLAVGLNFIPSSESVAAKVLVEIHKINKKNN